MRKIYLFALFFLPLFFVLTGESSAQVTPIRRIAAKRTNLPLKIDGLLNDSAWKDAALISDLVEFRPNVGAKELRPNRTEAFIMYNEEGIFFGGYCHERTRDSIATELKGRDGFGTNDYIGIIFDTYYDKLNGFEYFVTPLNEQWDAKMRPVGANSDDDSEDFSWNAVWKSGAKIHNDGWSFEMFIPYSAIRFSKKDIQDWGFNITRRRRKTEQQYTWNPINPTVNGFLTQEGLWTGLTNIEQPLRLQFSPYFSVYANHFPANSVGVKNLTGQVNGGLDLKYGLNQAFTLDMTLIPDFGQVQSDNQVLNLSPFEVRFNENRPFFNEGTELFSKGGLFYSRRIGGTPIRSGSVSSSLNPDEKITRNPTESQLINASKISGRSRTGLGIGFLNAVSKPQYATIENIRSKDSRRYQTNPLTNYNIFVLDQTLKHNSSISLVNTNMLRSGSDYDANVTAFLFDFNDKTNTWNLGGKAGNSNRVGFEKPGKTTSGYSSQLYVGKTSGALLFNISQDLNDTRYTHNDLGYFTNNNFIDHSLYMGYRWLKPKGWHNRINLNFNLYHSRLFSRIGTIDTRFQQANANINANAQMKKLAFVGVNFSFTPQVNDFYEPRNTGWFFKRGASTQAGIWFESNNAKKYQMYAEAVTRTYINFYRQVNFDLYTNHNYRFNNKLSMSYSFNYSPRFNGIGYAWSKDNEIVFGKRKVNTVENILAFKYNFSNMMGITFRARHYLSNVKNHSFYHLEQKTGLLTSLSGFSQPVDQNANYFNIDMVYTWQFAPGSFVNIVWKDNAYDYNRDVERNYFKNFRRTFEGSENNNVSLKVIYFLDYLQLKKFGNRAPKK